jgi:DNA-binding MarR family transcriptional regulator
LRAGLRRFLRRSEQVMRAHGLTPERYELLLAIKAEAHADTVSGPTISQLAETLELAHSSTTQLVRRAENHGLVKREVAPQDARIRYLRLTRKGEEQLAAATTALRPDRAQLAKASRQFTTQC